MFELFKAECRRFRWVALGVGVFHLGLLLFFDRVMDPLQQSRTTMQMVAVIYALVGALFGGVQFGLYARTNHWIALIHRPLSPPRIFGAVGGAGMAVLAAAIAVPLALFLLAHQTLVPRFVDARHWGMALSGTLFALIGYLSATYVALAPRRFGWLVFFLAIAPATASAVGTNALLLQALTTAAIGGLVLAMVKPDLSLAPPRRWPLALSALLLAFGIHRALLFLGDFAFQILWIMTGTHPLNSIPPKGGFVEASRAEGADEMIAGLTHRHDKQAQIWREQIGMSEVFSLPTPAFWVPVRHQMLAAGPGEFTDRKRNILWTFSHDTMAFHGVRQTDLQRAGTLRPDTPFPAPPVLAEGGLMLAGNQVYAFDEEKGTVRRRLSLPAGETVLAPPVPMGDAAVVLGDRAVHFFDRRSLEGDETPHAEIATVEQPAPVGNLQRLDGIELLDGYLLSFTYGADTEFGPTRAWQLMVEVDGNGQAHAVAERTMRQDLPVASRYARYWISPAFNLARTGLQTVGTGPAPNWKHEPVRVPTSVWIAALLIALATAAATALLARRRGLGRREGALWTLGALLLSLPFGISFWLLRPRPRG